MKCYLLVLILCASITTSKSQFVSSEELTRGEKTDLAKSSLIGPVKSVREVSYNAHLQDGKVVKGAKARRFQWEEDYYVEYNLGGYKVTQVYYENSGSIKSKTSFQYISEGLRSYLVLYGKENEVLNKITCKYDSKRNLIEELVLSPEGSIINKHTFDYDISGNLLSFRCEGQMNMSEYYKYDSIGNNIETKDKYGYLTKYKYDKLGNLTEKIHLTPEGTVQLKETNMYKGKILIKKHYFNQHFPPEFTSTYEYDYDLNGNWIRRIEYENGVPKFLIEREIIYYK